MPEGPGNRIDVEGYIRSCPPEVQARLLRIRDTIRRAAPMASETIKYGMPTAVDPRL